MVEWSRLVDHKLAIATVAAAAAVAAAVVMMRKRKRQEYELVGEVASLHCYPVKSCAGITSQVAYCTSRGMRMLNAMDRNFMIVRPSGDFITQRQIAKMVGIKVSCVGQELVLQADGMPQVRVPLNARPEKDKVVPCRIWSAHTKAQDCGEEVGKWLSEYLGEEGLRLLTLTPALDLVQCKYSDKIKMAFPDETPYMIASEESLAEVKRHIPDSADGPITMDNFRPSIVIKGTKRAWDEDQWSHVKIGKNLKMRIICPCERCLLTTVSPKTYERRCDGEPLKTLKTLRIFPEINPSSPLFGICAGVDVENTIRVGDPVYVIRKSK